MFTEDRYFLIIDGVMEVSNVNTPYKKLLSADFALSYNFKSQRFAVRKNRTMTENVRSLVKKYLGYNVFHSGRFRKEQDKLMFLMKYS